MLGVSGLREGTTVLAAWVTTPSAQTPSAPAEKSPAMTQKAPAAGEAAVVKVRGTIAAIDKENRTITL